MDQPKALKLFLHYPESSRSSRRVAEGRGDLARRVSEAASERGLPLGSNPDLVQLCARVDFGERLEPKLLDALAEVIGWLRLAGKVGPESADGAAPEQAPESQEI